MVMVMHHWLILVFMVICLATCGIFLFLSALELWKRERLSFLVCVMAGIMTFVLLGSIVVELLSG